MFGNGLFYATELKIGGYQEGHLPLIGEKSFLMGKYSARRNEYGVR